MARKGTATTSNVITGASSGSRPVTPEAEGSTNRQGNAKGNEPAKFF